MPDANPESTSDGARPDREQVFDGKVLDVGVERAEMPDGEVVDLEVVRHPGAAAVLPLLDDGRVVLVRQYRHATGGWLLEVPAGKLDPGEAPRDCARRETEEEVGYRPGRLRELGWIWTSPGFTDEKIHLYLADELEEGTQDLEDDEHLEIVRLPLDEAVEKARNGEIVDAKSICCLLRAQSARIS